MPEGPLVSVVVPTYNRNELLLGRALPSILSQSHRNLEVIVVADGMEQPELGVLQSGIESLDDSRVRFWNIERQQYPDDPDLKWLVLGLNARNFALDDAKGDWIASLDDDDAWHPRLLEVLLNAAVEAGADFAYCRSVARKANGELQLYGHWPPGFGAFCDGAYVYRNGMGFRYDPDCIDRKVPEDGDLWNRMVKAGLKFAFVPMFLHTYYPNPR